MTKHVLAVVAYLVATFATQALSHFVLNVGHYAAVTFMRAEPIFAFGMSFLTSLPGLQSSRSRAWCSSPSSGSFSDSCTAGNRRRRWFSRRATDGGTPGRPREGGQLDVRKRHDAGSPR